MDDEAHGWLEALDSGDSAIDRVAAAFQRRAARWQRFGMTRDHLLTQWESGVLTMAVDVDDTSARVNIRTLRADFDGRRVLVGRDSTGQLVEPLVEGDEVQSYDVTGQTPEAIGQLMAERLEPEILRPIIREEWDSLRFTRWVLADSGRELVWSSSTNRRPARLGEPQRRTAVWGPFAAPAG